MPENTKRRRRRRSAPTGKKGAMKAVKKYAPFAGVVLVGALLARSLGSAWDAVAGNKISAKADELVTKSSTGGGITK